MKKLLRWIARVALGLLALQAIFYAVLVAANGHDDPLTPEAAHLLAPPTPPASDAPNAYYVLLGLDAPDDEDVAVAGRRIRDERDRLFLRNPHNPHYPYKLFDPMGSIYWEKLRCSLKKGEDCVDFYLGEKVHMQQVMAQQPVLQQRYQQFSQIPVFDEPPVRSEFEPVPPYSALTLAAEMRLMAAVFALDKGDLQTGADILMQEIRVHRRLLANSTQLTTKMVSVGLLRLDYAVLSDALEHWPLLARQAALTEAWQPLREQEYDMREVVESEAIFQANLMYWAVKLQFVIQRPLSLPNATINTYTRWTNENAQDFEGDATTIDTRRQAYITRQVKEKEQIAAS
ncbi:MAG: hypothetical protein LBH10_06845, partial [Burkholderiaceae bacterium]|nr:hypothetical protein [Burkholderiaceae bacterium]